MGYTTQFSGVIKLSRKLTFAEAKTLLEYNQEPDDIPGTHPDSYMQWVPTESLDGIVWDGNEKFYSYTEWMEWICDWLKERGIAANGELYWSGESAGDAGRITVAENAVEAHGNAAPQTDKPRPLKMDALSRMALSQLTA